MQHAPTWDTLSEADKHKVYARIHNATKDHPLVVRLEELKAKLRQEYSVELSKEVTDARKAVRDLRESMRPETIAALHQPRTPPLPRKITSYYRVLKTTAQEEMRIVLSTLRAKEYPKIENEVLDDISVDVDDIDKEIAARKSAWEKQHVTAANLAYARYETEAIAKLKESQQ